MTKPKNPSGSPAAAESQPAGVQPPSRPQGSWIVAVTLCLGALGGGLLGWSVIEAKGAAFFAIPAELTPQALAPTPGGDYIGKQFAASNRATLGNNTANYAIVGAAIAALVGLAQGVRQRSLLRMALGFAAGLLVGAIAGAGAAYGVTLLIRQPAAASIAASVKSAMGQVICWGLVGFACGLSVSAGTRRPARVLHLSAAGSIGGLLGAALYGVLAPLLFPLSNTDLLVPGTSASRLLWIGVAAASIGLMLARSRARSPQASASA